MKKLIFITIFFLIINFVSAQLIPVNVNVLKQNVDILQKLIQEGQIQVLTSTNTTSTVSNGGQHEGSLQYSGGQHEGTLQILAPAEIKVIQPEVIKLPRGVKPALPQAIEKQSITREVIKSILNDEYRSNDVVIQINNLKITRILLNPGIENIRAILFAVRDSDWKCLLSQSEESEKLLLCGSDIRGLISGKELVIPISDTILLQKNRQRAKLEDFQVGDKINVYGFMDKKNYSIDALIVRNLNLPQVVKCKPRPACLDQTPPCLIPEPTEGWCPKSISSIKILSPNGGEVWQKGTTQFLKWQDNRQFTQPKTVYYDLSLIPKSQECIGRFCLLGAGYIPIVGERLPGQSGQEIIYEWEVGKVKDDRSLPDEEYKIQICESGTKNCVISKDYFRIVK